MPKSSNLTKDELARLLKENLQEWNLLREEYPAHEFDLSGVNLKGVHLGATIMKGFVGFAVGVNLNKGDEEEGESIHVPSKTSPSMVIEAGGYLPGANFNKVNLQNAILSNANLDGSDLRNADLRGADLRESFLRADLSKADLRGANIRNANLNMARLCKANLSGAFLSGATCLNVDFSQAVLRGTDLTQADLRDAIFADEFGNSADLSSAILKEVIFTREDRESVQGGFLELAAAENLETATFSSPEFLPNYIERAFKYAHIPNLPEASYYPEFFQVALSRIKALLRLYSPNEPPEELVEIVRLITDELIQYLSKHPEKIYEIRPRQFEEVIAEILASFGWSVQLTPSTKDGGFDIFAINKDISGLSSSWIIECKKYAPDRKVGIEIARALYGVKTDLRVSNAMLATTSSFTQGVRAFRAERYDFQLRDYEAILEWINEYRPNPNGKLYIKNNRLIMPKRA